MVSRGAWLEIDKSKLANNYMEVKRAVGPDVKICAVLKAQCYGIGAPGVAETLEALGDDAPDSYIVACVSEALELRPVIAPHKEILILGYVEPENYEIVIDEEITLTMYRLDLAEEFNRVALSKGKKGLMHIKLNTGMNRTGFIPSEDAADEIVKIMNMPGLEATGIFTHLAVADETDKSIAHMQMKRFDDFVEVLKGRGLSIPKVHVAASPAICDLPEYYRDMVRPGLLLTGYYSSEEVRRDQIKLQPCVKLKARLGNFMPVKAGEGVGYGHTYHLPEDTVIGLMPLGFSDGFTRGFSNDFFVTIRGHKCPVIGRICMDHCMIDLKDVPDPVIGEEIVVYGDGINGADGAMNVDEVAAKRDSIPDEVLTNINARVPRIFV